MSKFTSTVDVLSTSIYGSKSDLPEYSYPLPRSVVPWDVEFPIQTDVDKPAVRTVPDKVEPIVPDQQHQPITLPEPAPAVMTWSGGYVRLPFFFEDAHADSAFLHTFSPDKSDEFVALLQNNKCSAEPHPFEFSVNSAISMDVSSNPDTVTLREDLNQPDCHEFIKTTEK